MKTVYCVICRQSLPTLKKLRTHYIAAHSKIQLVKTIMKNENNKRKNSFGNVEPEYLKSEILYLEDGFQNSDDDNPPKIEIKTELEEIEETVDVKPVIVKIEEETQKNELLKLRNFRFDRTLRKNKKQEQQNPIIALNEHNGLFYICRCTQEDRNNNVVDCFQKNDLQNLISDTDSCSDVSTTHSLCYCDICGNGYASKEQLIEHFQVHNRNCGVCKKRFSNNFSYKQHMKRHLLKVFVCHLCGAEFGLKSMLMDHLDAHIEDDVFENIFSLEEDYKIQNRSNYFYFC